MQIKASIGGADSAIVGPGFFTKQAQENGNTYRWTTADAQLTIPWAAAAYDVVLRADSGLTTTHQLAVGQRALPLVSFAVQPGPRRYHILWSADLAGQWPASLSTLDIHLLTDARQISKGDPRQLGIVLSSVEATGLRTGMPPAAPLISVGLALLGLAVTLSPLSRRRLALLALSGLALPLLYELLVWHPPLESHAWLPLSWLPELVLLLLTGLLLSRLAAHSTRGVLVAIAVTGLIFAALLLTLRGQWRVDGPDYNWHLSHGGSWDRVFRAHEFYPFGFPLVLTLGEMWGNRALWLGQLACLIATLISFTGIVALAWRMLGRQQAWLSAVILLCAPIFVAYGVLASTDALMLAPATLALLALCWAPRPRPRHLLVGGLLLGLTYLFRFQAIVLLLPVLLWSLGAWGAAPGPEVDEQADTAEPEALDAGRGANALAIRAGAEQAPAAGERPASSRGITATQSQPKRLARLGRFTPAAVVLAGFLIGSAPQWLLDIRDTGRPFFTKQYANIWIFAYDRVDPMPDHPPGGDLLFLLNYDPAQLWRHWMANLRLSASATLHELIIWPVGVAVLFGLGALLWRRPDRRFLLLLLWTAVYVLAVTVTANKERFFLPVLPPLVICAVYLFTLVRARLSDAGARWYLLDAGLQVALWAWALSHLLLAERELALFGGRV